MFETKRQELLSKVIYIDDIKNLDGDFKREFFLLLEHVIVSMLEGEDNFFGYFLLKIKREIRLDITWPMATVPSGDGFIMYFNPILFLENNKKEMIALFKHEIYHIMYGHHEREKDLRDKYSALAVNLSLDISINQYIKNLPMNMQTIEKVKREYDVNLKDNDICDNYAKLINDRLKEKLNNNINTKNNEIARVVDLSKAHDIWSDVSMSKEQLKELSKKTAIASLKDNAPEDIKKIISEYDKKGEISWQDLLRRLLPSLRDGNKKTIMRRNRRQPNRLDLRGSLKGNSPQLIVAIDISASMSEDYYNNIMIELLNITKSNIKNILVIECDDRIRRTYTLKNKNDIKKRCKNTGATLFSPVFEFIKRENLREHVLIYFTDGVGESELETEVISKNVIWVLLGNEDLSLRKKVGHIKRIHSNKKIINDDYDNLEIPIRDWAK